MITKVVKGCPKDLLKKEKTGFRKRWILNLTIPVNLLNLL